MRLFAAIDDHLPAGAWGRASELAASLVTRPYGNVIDAERDEDALAGVLGLPPRPVDGSDGLVRCWSRDCGNWFWLEDGGHVVFSGGYDGGPYLGTDVCAGCLEALALDPELKVYRNERLASGRYEEPGTDERE